MTKQIKLFMKNTVHEALLYQYEDKGADLRALFFHFLTPLGKQGKITKLHGVLSCMLMGDDGKLKQTDIKIKDVEFKKFEIAENPNWRPAGIAAADLVVHEQVISDGLYDDLMYFGKVFCARLAEYNKSLDPKIKNYQKAKAPMPSCIEQIIFENVIGQIAETINKNMDTNYDAEFEEIEKEIKKDEDAKEAKVNPRSKKQ